MFGSLFPLFTLALAGISTPVSRSGLGPACANVGPGGLDGAKGFKLYAYNISNLYDLGVPLVFAPSGELSQAKDVAGNDLENLAVSLCIRLCSNVYHKPITVFILIDL